MSEKTLEGINGWLILVAIGTVLAPIRIIIVLVTTYPEIFSSGAWKLLTTPGSGAYNPMWKILVMGELLINCLLLVALLYLAYLFFSKSRSFPKWFIGIAIASIVFTIADSVAVKMLLPNDPVIDSDAMKQLARSMLVVFIWIPYMLISKRVKAIFVK
jgi:hypothetical protein